MEKFIALAICIILTIVIGASFIMGDTNSVQSSLGDIMEDTTTQIDGLSD